MDLNNLLFTNATYEKQKANITLFQKTSYLLFLLLPTLHATTNTTSQEEKDLEIFKIRAEIYNLQEDFKNEHNVLQAISKLLLQKSGKNHPDYATSLNNIANNQYNQGKLDEALTKYTEALQIYKKKVGWKTHAYATVLNNI